MLILLQLLTVAALVGGTFLLFKALGPQPGNLLYTKAEKEKWEAEVGGRMITWFTRTNIVGTLTSLATVYLFFIGNSKVFGAWILLCSVSMCVGVKVTNTFTAKIWSSDYIQGLLKDNALTGGVIASVFWRPSSGERQTARTVKWLSLISIGSFIWLDFALFADISGSILGMQALWFRVVVLALVCFLVVYFTLKYGIRGFVFADIFHAPLIAFATAVLIAGCIILAFGHSTKPQPIIEFLRPLMSQSQCVLFAVHVFCLNLFFVVLSEAHWLRLWIFGDKEVTQQKPAIFGMSALWVVLMAVGFFASNVSGGDVGEKAVVTLLEKLASISWAFPVAFWIGGTSALFSSADSQIYSFLIVRRFNVSTGKLDQLKTAEVKPCVYAALTTGVFSVGYALIRHFHIPFEKLIFIVMPMTLNILPALVFAVRGHKQRPWLIWFSIAAYAYASVRGLREPERELAWTLCAALMPIIASMVAFLITLTENKKE